MCALLRGGIGLAMGVWVSAGVSGGHINPAVRAMLLTFTWTGDAYLFVRRFYSIRLGLLVRTLTNGPTIVTRHSGCHGTLPPLVHAPTWDWVTGGVDHACDGDLARIPLA